MNPQAHRLSHLVAAAALACAAGATSLAIAATPTLAPDSTMAKIQKRGELVVGVKFDVPMFGQKNPLTGQLQGLSLIHI